MPGNHIQPRLRIGYAIAFLAFLALGIFAAPDAGAQEYGPGSEFTVNPTSVAVGESFTATGSGCAPGATVTFFLDGTQIGTTVANPDGTFGTTLIVPAGTAPGPHVVTATCGELVQTGRVVVTGVPGGGSPGNGTGDDPPDTLAFAPEDGELARTGSSSETVARMAILLIAVGVILLVIARRDQRDRRSQAS